MNILRTWVAFGCGLLLVFLGADASWGQDSNDRRAEALEVTSRAAKEYTFELAGPQPQALTFHPASILHWSNPVAGEVFGNVFVWTHQGRPEVIGSLHQWYSPLTHGSHEFHSLSTGPVRGSRDGQPVWNSERPGIELRRVPGQQAVGESPVARLRQMRAIARRFTVQKTDREAVTREMRLLAQPVYRYPTGKTSVLDGALFVFVQGTDPEVILQLETRQIDGAPQWHFALARMNSVKFVAKYDGRAVWNVEIWPWSQAKNGIEPYTQYGPFNLPAAPN